MNNFINKLFKKNSSNQNEPFDYEEYIKKAAKSKSEIRIPFSTFEHAILITYSLIKNAKQEVKIFTNYGNKLFCDSRIDKIINDAIKKGVKFKILFEPKKSPRTLFSDNFECKTLEKESYLWRIRQQFLISDSYRFSLNDPKQQTEGIVCFKDPESCKNLQREFDSAFNKESTKS